jgi:exodeoxyribonuclease VII large subunit
MSTEAPAEPRIYSVRELAQGINRILEQRTEGLSVEGEVGRVQRPSSGHLYFTLKDDLVDATLDCVVYKREAMRFGRYVEEGARVVVRGRASYYAPRGRLQWVGSTIRPSGQGALLAMLEALKKRLAAEGLFDPARKRPLPRQPKVVGVITSRTGAAFHDICTVAARRGRVRIVLSPAVVQGEEAPRSLIAALDRIEALPDLDVLIVGRGGGSQEDLSAFNDEGVVRRLSMVRVPIVSAVGHEIDITLADFVADVRAATPSEAAELVVRDMATELRILREFVARLGRLGSALVSEGQVRLSRLERSLGDPRFLLVNRGRELDELQHRLALRMRTKLAQGHERERSLRAALNAFHPKTALFRARANLAPLIARLLAVGPSLPRAGANRLRVLAGRLDSLSPLMVLGRGYALVFGPDGRAVRSPDEVGVGDELKIRVSAGEIQATVASHRLK